MICLQLMWWLDQQNIWAAVSKNSLCLHTSRIEMKCVSPMKYNSCISNYCTDSQSKGNAVLNWGKKKRKKILCPIRAAESVNPSLFCQSLTWWSAGVRKFFWAVKLWKLHKSHFFSMEPFIKTLKNQCMKVNKWQRYKHLFMIVMSRQGKSVDPNKKF